MNFFKLDELFLRLHERFVENDELFFKVSEHFEFTFFFHFLRFFFIISTVDCFLKCTDL